MSSELMSRCQGQDQPIGPRESLSPRWSEGREFHQPGQTWASSTSPAASLAACTADGATTKVAGPPHAQWPQRLERLPAGCSEPRGLSTQRTTEPVRCLAQRSTPATSSAEPRALRGPTAASLRPQPLLPRRAQSPAAEGQAGSWDD